MNLYIFIQADGTRKSAPAASPETLAAILNRHSINGLRPPYNKKENWFDENDSRHISFDEWKNILASDNEMRLDGFAEATATNGETIRVDSKGLAVWTKYSNNGLNGNYAWFDYSEGNIVCKNPDDEIINKMLVIAERLNAKVQGDEGEIYERSLDNKIFHRHITKSNDNQTDSKKPWWKFW